MDIDALQLARKDQWDRMRVLSRQRTMSGAQVDELARLYQITAGDLAAVRSQTPDADLQRTLSVSIGRARAALTGTQGMNGHAIAYWFRRALPAALYRTRWWILGVTAAFIVFATWQAWALMSDPTAMGLIGTASQLENYAKHDFVQYYSQDTHAEFGLSVWVNNAWIAVVCIGAGITGVLPIKMMLDNALNLGVSAAIVIHYASPAQFFSFILPHGLPELTAIFTAGGAGLRTCWSMLVPGHRTRLQAVAHTGRSMMTVAGGCVLLLLVSGFLEGFVTPSSLPVWFKIAAGVLVVVAFWVLIFSTGRRAAQEGATGDLETDTGYSQPVAG